MRSPHSTGKSFYLTLHLVVLFFVFLPGDRHLLAIRSEYVLTEAEVKSKVSSRRRLLSLVAANPVLRGISLLGSRNDKAGSPEVFILLRVCGAIPSVTVSHTRCSA